LEPEHTPDWFSKDKIAKGMSRDPAFLIAKKVSDALVTDLPQEARYTEYMCLIDILEEKVGMSDTLQELHDQFFEAIDKKEIIQSPNNPLQTHTLWEKIRGVDKEEKRLLELTEKVAKKLLTDILEEGRVSLFHKKATGKLDTVLCTVYLTSPKIPCLYVMLWNESTLPDQKSIDFHKKFFGVVQHKRFISAIEGGESSTRRAIAIIQRWDMPDGSYEINYRRDADKEGTNMPVPRSAKEKIKFLEEILQMTVDKAETAEPFKRPYTPGDTYGGGETADGRIHHAYWARDLKGEQLTDLFDAELPKLTG
jgi:hypothetical protein